MSQTGKGGAEFVHLHLHTQYSLLDGAIRLSDLFSLVQQQGMHAVAMTDHGNIYGAVDFYQQAKKAGVKPIIGCELYVAAGDHREKGGDGITSRDNSNHLLVLVENEEGYKNLNRLLTHAHLDGFYYKPRVDKELLARYNEGLMASSACLKGEVAQKILKGDDAGAKEAVDQYRSIFPGRYYLEMMENGLEDQRLVNRGLVRLAKEMDLPLVATNDCHYLTQNDADAHDVLLCIQTGKTISDPGRMRLSSRHFYVKSAEEMISAFRETPQAIKNTLEIAERCNLEFTFGEFQFPEYEVPGGGDLAEYFVNETRHGFEGRMAALSQSSPISMDRYRDRLEREIAMITRMGFAGYFLIVADFINFAKSKHIPVGPGRGSAAGSLVAYSLGITDIDPMPYDLMFERFLNPERISMPDIDIDFCKNGRDEVIQYVSEKYGGEERVAQIITFGTMQARGVIRDVGRALDMSYPEVDRIAKLIPSVPLNITLDEAVKKEARLRDMIAEDDRVRRLLEIARSLEGLNRHASTHAAGIVIANRALTDYMPLTRGQKGEVVSQFDMKCVEKLGLIKFDFLGLRTLTVIDHAVSLIENNQGVKVDISNIPLDDPKTFELLQSGRTDGVFQLESSGMKDLMVRLVPEKFEEVIALVALYRPGPLNTGMAEEYIRRKHKPSLIAYELEQLRDILEDTYGVIVYQEQVMQMASSLARFSAAEGDLLRRAMGKKIREEMAAQKKRFLDGARTNEIKPKIAEKIFKDMEEFAEYGFNKSHSAAYALVSFRTAYLKAHYPVEFMAALLTSEMDDTDKIIKYMAECREMNIDVLPPDVNESGLDFTVSGETIRFGLLAVKNVGGQAIESIIESRNDGGGFASLYDFCRRVDLRRVNKRVIESLIKCGALDSTAVSRAKMIAAVDKAVDLGQLRQEEQRKGQMNIFDTIEEVDLGEYVDEYPDVPEWDEAQSISCEKECLGFYLSGHPLFQYRDVLKTVATADSTTLGNIHDKETVHMAGIISSVREVMTKKGDRMAFVTLEDLKGMVEVIVFSDVFNEYRDLLVEDNPVLLTGTVDRGEESSKVIASGVAPLSSVRATPASRTVYIDVHDLSLSTDCIERLKGVIDNNRGEVPVMLRLFDNNDGFITINLKNAMGVDPSEEFITQVGELFSERAVTVRSDARTEHQTGGGLWPGN
ncbi:MAG: DNA polymerase III subunit alpha [Deltaproteobacteria bacterium]|nr:DNA polymerase III subunit alpha [Candidatus Zymogenaceae bacterium]